MQAICFMVIFIFFIILTPLLLGLVIISGKDFWSRHQWRVPVKASGNRLADWMRSIDLGRLFCVWIFRAWLLFLALTLLYFFGGKYVA